jgi:hypothetical protein
MPAPRPPACTSTRSSSTRGDSLRPQRMLEPPNVLSTFTVQIVLPVAASRTDRSPLAPNAYTRSPSTVGVLRGPLPRSLLNRRPLAVSHTRLPVATSNATTYSVLPRAPRVNSRPSATAIDE